YLLFNEGYSASSGAQHIRSDLTKEAIRLGRLLSELLPDSEALGLLALMLFHESRRAARATAAGDVVLLEDQDRSLWDQDLIREGQDNLGRAFATGEVGEYTIQAAISAVHSAAKSATETDWARIVSFYDMLLAAGDSPIIRLNRAVALAMRDG